MSEPPVVSNADQVVASGTPGLRTMAAVDVASFGHRADSVQTHLRTTLYELLREAFDVSGAPWDRCRHEDRGDGVLIIAPLDVPAAVLLDPMLVHLDAAIRRHNQISSKAAQLRLRIAVHTGYVAFDDFGVFGSALDHLFRLLEARSFKEMFHRSELDVGLITSDYFFDSVVRHGLGMLNPAGFTPIKVQVKETDIRGWVYLPGRPADSRNSTARSQHAGERTGIREEGTGTPRAATLPDLLPIESLPNADQTGRSVPLGIDEDTLSPVLLDFESNPHFVVFGEAGGGKTNLLHLLADAIVARNSPSEARMVFVDYRRSLPGTADTEYHIGYASSPGTAGILFEDVARALRARLPPPGVTSDQLRSRSWWKGPDLYLIVDDYDLVATSQDNPLLPLADLLTQASDIGLHLILSCTTGARRPMDDQLLQQLAGMNTPTLIMSGSTDADAPSGDVRPRPLPAGRGQFTEPGRGTRLVQSAFIGTRTR